MTKAVEIASGRSSLDESQHDQILDQNEESSTSSESSSSEEADVALPNRSEIQECYTDIVEIVDKLYRMSIAIRSPSVRTATSKALSYIERNEIGNDIFNLFEDYTFKRIRAQYPDLSESLVLRLAQSISRRRRMFMYRRKHRKKLEVVEEEIVRIHDQPTPSHIPTRVDPGSSQGNIAIHLAKPAPSLLSKSILSQTTATDYVPRTLAASEVASSTAFTSVASDVLGKNEISIPPVSTTDDKDFECPYCFCILSGKYKQKKLWEYVYYTLFPFFYLLY
jgi:hypothetical protein